MENGENMSTLSTVNVYELTYFHVLCQVILVFVAYPYTVFIISQVEIAILVTLLERHNVANPAMLKLTATWCQV